MGVWEPAIRSGGMFVVVVVEQLNRVRLSTGKRHLASPHLRGQEEVVGVQTLCPQC